jgi:hypothetical protein
MRDTATIQNHAQASGFRQMPPVGFSDLSLTPCFSGVLVSAGDQKTVSTVFRESEGHRK